MKIQSTPHRLPLSYTMVFIWYSKVLLKYHGIVSKSHRMCWFLEIQSIMEISLKCWTIRAEAALTTSHCSCLTLLWRLNLLNSAIHPNPRASESCQSSATHRLMPRDLMSGYIQSAPIIYSNLHRNYWANSPSSTLSVRQRLRICLWSEPLSRVNTPDSRATMQPSAAQNYSV